MDPLQDKTSGPAASKSFDVKLVTVAADFQLVEKKQLKLRLAVKNGTSADIFLLNRLWTLNAENRRIADPESVYRFVHKDTIRLLFGSAPLPRLSTVTYRNWPEMTLLAKGKTFEAEYALALPLREYNVYYLETTADNSDEVKVEHAEVILHVLAAGEAVKTQPSAIEEGAFQLISAQSLADVQVARAEPKKLPLTALRRTDEFSRVVLPGEKPEPLPLK